jgi:hypothetical protein
MKKTEWRSEKEGDVFVGGRHYASGDSGAPMLCSLVCAHLGRHAHLELCEQVNGNCRGGTEVEHVKQLTEPGQSNRGSISRDWVAHRLYWERSGQ